MRPAAPTSNPFTRTVPFLLLETWLQGHIALSAGGLLKQRLLYGAMRMDPDEIFRMAFTSGTNGDPKCVIHSFNSTLYAGVIRSTASSFTGPSNPDSSGCKSAVQWCQVVKVNRPLGDGLPPHAASATKAMALPDRQRNLGTIPKSLPPSPGTGAAALTGP